MNAKRNIAHTEEQSWGEVREAVKAVNPELSVIIDQLDPGPELTFFKVIYPYGKVIFNEGDFFIPNPRGDIVPLQHASIPRAWSEKLGYHSNDMPTTLGIKHSVEFYKGFDNGVSPIAIIHPGKLFGLWRSLDPIISYHPADFGTVTSGARSVFMLPKITDVISHKRLAKRYRVRASVPQDLYDHWKVFTEIANHIEFGESWATELLFFSHQWFVERRDDINWLNFRLYLYESGWRGSDFWRNKFLFDFMWSAFILELIKQNHRPSHHLLDIVKHLIIIATGNVPGFRPQIENTLLPMTGLQLAYREVYGLKNYFPILFGPEHFGLADDGLPIYYSLQMRTQINYSLRSKGVTSVISDLREIKDILDKFRTAVVDGHLRGVRNTPIFQTAANTQFDFFHNAPSTADGIKNTLDMPDLDSRLQQHAVNYAPDLRFSEAGPFVRGCVRIMHK